MFVILRTILFKNMEKRKKIKLIASVAIILPALIVLYYFLLPLVDYITYGLIGLNADSHFGSSINFSFTIPLKS